MTTELDSLHPAMTAADYMLAALGKDGARLALYALRAGWLRPDEAAQLEPVAVALAYLLELETPKHRGTPATVTVARATAAAGHAIAAALEEAREAHVLELLPIDGPHRKYRARCACGWMGPKRARKELAEADHGEHVTVTEDYRRWST